MSVKQSIVFFLLLPALIASANVSCQDTVITWMDATFEETDEDRAGYFRKGWAENGLWMIEDYFIDGQLQMTGSFNSSEEKNKHGLFVFYGENENKLTEGNYENAYLDGIWTKWYEDGSLSEKGAYYRPISKGPKTLAGNSQVAEQLELSRVELSVFKTGNWEYYHANGKKSGNEVFDKGQLITANYWNEDGSEAGDKVVLEQTASFPGGNYWLPKYLKRYIKYPLEERKKRINGIVYVQFTVDRDGNIKDAKIVQSVSPNLDSEALRVVKSMPVWQPAIMHNRRVSMIYTLPIQFALF